MAKTLEPAKPTRRTAVQKTSDLYCSFCGKSQHEVSRLIAGPTVFICDECVDLCDDIIFVENTDRVAVKIKIPALSAYDDLLMDGLSRIVDEIFPGQDLRFEFRTPTRDSDAATHNLAVFSIRRPSDDAATEVLQDQVAGLASRLSVMTTKFIHESKRAVELTEQLTQLKSEYLDFLRAEQVKLGAKSRELRCVMFMDISGFSKFSHDHRQTVLELLRGITPPLIRGRGGQDLNMWGDAIVANFADPNQALEIAAKFLRHLNVEQLEARIGMAWGEVRFAYNEAIGRKDIEGDVVNLAARLEPLAPLGGVLLSKEFGALEINEDVGELISVKRKIEKDTGDWMAGANLDFYEFRFRKN